MEKIVVPWEVHEFVGGQERFSLITEKLYERGYVLANMAERPSEKVSHATGDLMTTLLELMHSDDDVLPWVLVLSNSPRLMQALAKYVPVTFALTCKGRSVVSTTTSELLTLFRDKGPRSSFDPDPAGEAVATVRASGLTFWQEVDDSLSGVNYHHGRFSDIINYRVGWKMPTVFTSIYGKDPKEEFNEKTLYAKVIEKIRSNLGTTASAAIDQECMVVYYSVEEKDSYGTIKRVKL